MRAAALTLFGNLAMFGSGTSREQFLEQVHTNLVAFLLHLNDPENQVRQVTIIFLYLRPYIVDLLFFLLFHIHIRCCLYR